MTMRNDELDRLLAQGRLSGPARDRILERVLKQAVPRRRRWRAAFALALPATAVALLLLLWPRHAFTPKGNASAASFLDVSCVDGNRGHCRSGQTLLFHIGGASQGGVLLAWAEPERGGERIWYAPTPDGGALEVPPSTTIQTLTRGALLGPEQPPGRYLIHLVLATRPLSRSEALAANGDDVIAAATVPLEVTP